MSGATEHTLSIEGQRLACRLWGRTDALPAIALHGWLDNAASFDVLAPLLPAVRLCALDLPGHGRSDHRPAGSAYHFVDYVLDVLRAADALGWRRFALFGHSMGAGVSTLLAAVAPERVTCAVLIEGLGPQTTTPSGAPDVLRRAIADALRPPGEPSAYATFEDAVQARMAGVGRVSAAAARLLCERGLERTPAGFVWRSDRRLRAGSRLRLTEEHALAFIRAMKVPTLLIRAEPGLPVDEAQYAARAAAHPDLRVVRMSGSHHLHMEAEAAEVARVVREFLDDAGPRMADAL